MCTMLLCCERARHSANSGSSSDAAETDTVATDSTVSLVAAAAAEEGSSSTTNATSSSSSNSRSSSSGGLAGVHSAAHTKASSSQVQHHMAVIGEDCERRPSSAGVTVTDFSVKAHAKVRNVRRGTVCSYIKLLIHTHEIVDL
jgi:hypothetical protein